ncbi:MAG TPA: potassium-transporting ATPase subunit KdpA [Acetobacteraceae bacterium]|nr:potassium-transporting ATPase subunit KdpA [Acetobacteraceae bacterium]
MTWQGWAQIALFAALVIAAVRPLGGTIARVIEGGSTPLQRLFGPLETMLYRVAGVDPAEEQTWPAYAFGLLAFSLAGVAMLYALQRVQSLLPLNPQHLGAVSPDLALNTAVSFVSNTSWQSYAGETTLSYLTQMAGITVQSFLSAAAGVAVAIALVRGFARRSVATIGNVWVDLTRATLYILLPICVVASLFLVWQGVPQTLDAYAHATTLEGAPQLLARGPVASQEAIKLLSGDGGGFFNANSAHPFENPTALAGLIEMLLIFLLGSALTNTFGRMVGDERQGWALFAVMAAMFLAGAAAIYASEAAPNPAFAPFHLEQSAGDAQAGGNMEGKEVRFGVAQSALFATVSTASSDGAVDAMHDSFMPVSGLILLANMMLDEVIVGGPGSGLFGMLLFAVVAVFVAGLMIGRTPEYLGKKIEANEIKMTMLVLLTVPAFILLLTAVAAVLPAGLAGLNNAGPHGFSELLYAYTSAAGTNGSAFAGLSANTPFFNLTLALAMFAGRFLVFVPVLCIAGGLAAKRIVPASAGTLPTHGAQFVGLLIGTVVIVGGLTFFPALALGPVAEQFAMQAGMTY